jgi:N-acetylmuramoyl-L-alanine amidase
MNRRRKWSAAIVALAAVFALTTPAALAAQVAVDGAELEAEQGWIENGVSYITLRAYAAATPYILTWDGACAYLTGEGLALSAQPGALYVTVNDRAIYVPGGVQVKDGKMVLPVAVLAKATGDELVWDAEAGCARLTCLLSPPQADYDEEDLYWLARIISAESQGEPLLGQMAVGNVVLNRVDSDQYPDTIKQVVFDRTDGVQFEPTSNGTIYDDPTDLSVLAAKLCLEGARPVENCLYFYAPAISSGTWIVKNCTYYTTIGCHKFYY